MFHHRLEENDRKHAQQECTVGSKSQCMLYESSCAPSFPWLFALAKAQVLTGTSSLHLRPLGLTMPSSVTQPLWYTHSMPGETLRLAMNAAPGSMIGFSLIWQWPVTLWLGKSLFNHTTYRCICSQETSPGPAES